MKDEIRLLSRTIKRKDIISASMNLKNSLSNDELSIDTLDFRAFIRDLIALISSDKFALKSSDNYLLVLFSDDMPAGVMDYTENSPVEYYRDGGLFGRFYLSSVEQQSKYQFSISCMSAINLLADSRHYGGIYSGTLMPVVLADIIGGIVGYTLDAEFTGIAIYGWLPIDSRRNNLQQLLFATGGCVLKNADGSLRIAKLNTSNPKAIPDERIYQGSRSTSPNRTKKGVSITEHSYIQVPTVERGTLFEGSVTGRSLVTPNGASVLGNLIEFSEPYYSLQIASGMILESGVNYAVLGPATDCTLTGIPYVHTTSVLSLNANGQVVQDQTSDALVVDDATLVNALNGPNVADRTLSYYSKAGSLKSNIVLESERPGDPVKINNAYDVQESGIVESLDITVGAQKLKASMTVATQFIPGEIGNIYNKSVVLVTAGTFTVAYNCKRLHVVLIQGGTGGTNGTNGEPGSNASAGGSQGETPGTLGGKGGSAGTAGGPGHVLEVSIDVTPGQVIQAYPGAGGTSGQAGAHSLFAGYSSSSGSVPQNGWTDLLSGVRYALSGSVGFAGADGGKGGGLYASAQAGSPGEDVLSWKGGTGGSGADRYGVGAAGPGGGGAAYGASGGNGADSTVTQGGNAGNGANAATPQNQTSYGSGGNAGHGGGGGGGIGAVTSSVSKGKLGQGGIGSAGSSGGSGAVIIYYKG